MDALRTIDGTVFLKDTATPLYNISGDEPVLWAWMDENCVLHDSDYLKEVKIYRVFGVDYSAEDSPQAETFLRDIFEGIFDESPEQLENLKQDKIALREAFANWSDIMCKNGEICEDSYNELDPY